MKRLALISAAKYAKNTALNAFADNLVLQAGMEVLASGGTHTFLSECQVPVTNISTIVGEPILGHRVVTLSREIFAGILATNSADDMAELERIGIGRIELVYVAMYDLERMLETELAKPNPDFAMLRENIDIGGPSLLRAAGKGDRLVICHESQCMAAMDAMCGRIKGEELQELKLRFAIQAEEAVQRHSQAAVKVYSAIHGRLVEKV